MDAEALDRHEIELDISLMGLDDVTMQNGSRKPPKYTDKRDQVRPSLTIDMMRVLPGGDVLVDLTKFDSIVPEHQPRDSVPG